MYSKFVTGRQAVAEHEAIKARGFDWSRHDLNGPAVNRSGRGFDAAGSSGYAFLQSQLELIEPKLVEPLQAVTHERDLPIKLGGGFPEMLTAWASRYASSGSGLHGLQGTNNTNIPIAQASVDKGSWPTFNWAAGFTVSYIDLERMKTAAKMGGPPPFTLQSLYEQSVKTVWLKDLDQVAYFGFLGNAGLVNNPNVPATVAANGAAGKSTWASKTFNEILTDVNFGINQCIANSGYNIDKGAPDRLLVPYTQYALLTLPATIGGVGYQSGLEYLRKNSVAAQYFGNQDRFKIFPLPNPWISGQGIGNTAAQNAQGNGLDRAVFYRCDEDDLVLKIPTVMEPAMTIPTANGPGWTTIFVGCLGALMFLRTTTVAYLDGI